MSLFELYWIGQRRGLRLPLLLGRLHLGLIFSGPSSGSGRKSPDNCVLRSFLFITAILITKCGSSSFPNPNRTKNLEGVNHNHVSGSPPPSSSSSSPSSSSSTIFSIKHADEDYQDFPLEYHKFQSVRSSNFHHIEEQYYSETTGPQNVKTLGYFLKGLILPMLLSLTLSFGFVIYKNRVKRARLQQIQNSLEEARTNPNQIPSYRHHDALLNGHGNNNGFVSNALLSFIDARGEWNLVTGNEGPLLEGDDYIGEGGETARHKPYLHDLPPAYATVFDPPSYEEAIVSLQPKRTFNNAEMFPTCSTTTMPEMEDDDEAKHLMSADFSSEHD